MKEGPKSRYETLGDHFSIRPILYIGKRRCCFSAMALLQTKTVPMILDEHFHYIASSKLVALPFRLSHTLQKGLSWCGFLGLTVTSGDLFTLKHRTGALAFASSALAFSSSVGAHKSWGVKQNGFGN